MTDSQPPAPPDPKPTVPSRTAADYDELPYPSLPVSYCHPSSVAATVSLFKVSPPPVDGARVLELGCASGGNLIPLAVQFPKSKFLGIDLSEVQVNAANARIAGLGLKNITVRQADLLSLNLDGQEFDYILCHGVFSWVPRPTQDAVFNICSKNLSPHGAAVISFNVLPGWHLRRVVRDICLTHAGTTGTALERAQKARQALIEISRGAKGNDLYASLLRVEAQRLQKMPFAYIMGEFLAETNIPVHFTEFYARAKQVGLSYVCDAEVSASLAETVSPASAPHIKAMARGSAAATQQYIDFFSGRPFRRAVLVREGRVPNDFTQIDPVSLRNLHFSAELSLDRKAEAQPGFVDAKGRKLSAANARSHALLTKLASNFPATSTLQELLAGEQATPENEKQTLSALHALIARGQASVFATPVRVGRSDREKPLAWPIARLDAKENQPWVTSLHHRAVRKIPSLSLILHLMDGTHTRAQLQSVLQAAIEKGELKTPQKSNGASPSALSAAAELNGAIAYAARNGLLEP